MSTVEQIMPTSYYLPPPPDFQTFLRPCDQGKEVGGRNGLSAEGQIEYIEVTFDFNSTIFVK